MTGPPPPRYRVVERGRRLEVIDTRAATPPRPAPLPGPRARDGGWTFETRRWFDDKGPRRIAIDADRAQRLPAIAALLVVALVMALAGLKWLGIAAVVPVGVAIGAISRHARPWVTRWLDRYADPGQSSR